MIIDSNKFSAPHLAAIIAVHGDRVVVAGENLSYLGHEITHLVCIDFVEEHDLEPGESAQIIADNYGIPEELDDADCN